MPKGTPNPPRNGSWADPVFREKYGFNAKRARMSEEEREKYMEELKNKRLLKKLTIAKLEEKADELTNDLLAAAKVQLEKAIKKGNTYAFEAVWDRTMGKPAQSVDVTSDGKAITAIQAPVYSEWNGQKYDESEIEDFTDEDETEEEKDMPGKHKGGKRK